MAWKHLSSLFVLLQIAQAQINILSPPVGSVAPLNVNVSFQCSTVSSGITIIWSINKTQISGDSQVDIFASRFVYVPLPTINNHSEMIITAHKSNNNTMVECVAADFDTVPISIQTSDTATLQVYSEPAPPTNLSIQLPTQGLDVTLSWVPGFSLEGEDVIFVITYTEVESGNESILCTNLSSAVLNPTSTGSSCREYRFTVHSENLFGPSISDISHVTVVPTVPLSLDSNDINATLSYEGGTFSSAILSFDTLSPCLNYSVERYILVFSEVTNEFMEGLAPDFNVTQLVTPGERNNVRIEIFSGQGVLVRRQYNVTVIAFSSAGTSSSFFMLYTTGLRSSQIVDLEFSSALISCTFSTGAPGLGCHISFGAGLGFNITRMLDSEVAMADVPFPEDIAGQVTIFVAEILPDGTLSTFTVQLVVNIEPSTTQSIPNTSELTLPNTSESLTKLMESPTEPPSEFTTQMLENERTALYIGVGAVVAVIISLLFLICCIIVCVVRINRHKKRIHLVETSTELKPNGCDSTSPCYTLTTEISGIENGRQARSNTYDDPQQHLSGVSVMTPVPTYETVQSAKKATLSASGPPVLNPVYGPTGSPSVPTSPIPKSVPTPIPNPVYSQTGSKSNELPDVSPLSPVYAAIDTKVSATSASFQFDDKNLHASENAKASADPLYEELHRKKAEEESMTRNESYGLFKMNEIRNSSKQ